MSCYCGSKECPSCSGAKWDPRFWERLGEATKGVPFPKATGTRPTLTEKEMSVLKLCAEGKTTEDISKMLGNAVKTIERHRQHIIEKLGGENMIHAVVIAIRDGVLNIWEK